MAPPPNRDDELESRAEYYKSFARESFMNESDCLEYEPLKDREIKRFLLQYWFIRSEEKDRKWLLGDMMFPDPYKDAVDTGRIQNFERLAEVYLGRELEPKKEEQSPNIADDGFWDDDEAESDDPEFFQKKFPHLR